MKQWVEVPYSTVVRGEVAEAGCSAAACTIGHRAARPLLQSAQSAAQRASSARDPQEQARGWRPLWRSRRFDRAGARVAGSEDVAARIHVDAHDLRVPVGLGVVLDPHSLARRRARLDDEAIVDARVLRASARRVELVVGVGQLAYVGSKMARASAGAPEASPSARSCRTRRAPSPPASSANQPAWAALAGPSGQCAVVDMQALAWLHVRVADGGDGVVR